MFQYRFTLLGAVRTFGRGLPPRSTRGIPPTFSHPMAPQRKLASPAKPVEWGSEKTCLKIFPMLKTGERLGKHPRDGPQSFLNREMQASVGCCGKREKPILLRGSDELLQRVSQCPKTAQQPATNFTLTLRSLCKVSCSDGQPGMPSLNSQQFEFALARRIF